MDCQTIVGNIYSAHFPSDYQAEFFSAFDIWYMPGSLFS